MIKSFITFAFFAFPHIASAGPSGSQAFIVENPSGQFSLEEVKNIGSLEGIKLSERGSEFHDNALLIRTSNQKTLEALKAQGFTVSSLTQITELSSTVSKNASTKSELSGLIEDLGMQKPVTTRWKAAAELLVALRAFQGNLGLSEEGKKDLTLRLLNHEFFLNALFQELQLENEILGRKEYLERVKNENRASDVSEMYRAGREYAKRNRSTPQTAVAAEIRNILIGVPAIGSKESLLWPLALLAHGDGVALDAVIRDQKLLNKLLSAELTALSSVVRQTIEGVQSGLHLQDQSNRNSWQTMIKSRNIPGLDSQRSSLTAGFWNSPETQYFTNGLFGREGGSHLILGANLSESQLSLFIENLSNALVNAERSAQPVLAKAMRDAEEKRLRASYEDTATSISDENQRRQFIEDRVQSELARFDHGFMKGDGFGPVDRYIETLIYPNLPSNLSADRYMEGAMRLIEQVIAKTSSNNLRSYAIASGLELINTNRKMGRQGIQNPATRQKAAEFASKLRAEKRSTSVPLCRSIFGSTN